jgi:hypothetical protein
VSEPALSVPPYPPDVEKAIGEIVRFVQMSGPDAASVSRGKKRSALPLAVQLRASELYGELPHGLAGLSDAEREMVYEMGPDASVGIARAMLMEGEWVLAARLLDEYARRASAGWRVHKWRGIAHAMSGKGYAADAMALQAYEDAIAACRMT